VAAQTRGIGNRFAPLLCRCFLAVPPLLFVLFLWPKMWLIQLLRPVDGDVSAANSSIPRPGRMASDIVAAICRVVSAGSFT
jgi:hypothetical protein